MSWREGGMTRERMEQELTPEEAAALLVVIEIPPGVTPDALPLLDNAVGKLRVLAARGVTVRDAPRSPG